MNLIKRGLRDRRRSPGQILVEMAIIAPFLLLLLCAIFEFGWYFYTLSIVNNCTRFAARVGAAGQNNTTITGAVNNTKGSVVVSSITVTVTTSAGASVSNTDRTTGNYLTVQVASAYQSLTRIVDFNQLAGITQIRDSNTFVIGY